MVVQAPRGVIGAVVLTVSAALGGVAAMPATAAPRSTESRADKPAPTDAVAGYPRDVTLLSATEGWAVGDQAGSADHSRERTFTMHWDGTTWSTVSSPNHSFRASWLSSVDEISPDDVWAVGGWEIPSSNRQLALIEHWDGVRWTIVPDNGVAAELDSVDAVSATDVWAVGSADASPQRGRRSSSIGTAARGRSSQVRILAAWAS